MIRPLPACMMGFVTAALLSPTEAARQDTILGNIMTNYEMAPHTFWLSHTHKPTDGFSPIMTAF